MWLDLGEDIIPANIMAKESYREGMVVDGSWEGISLGEPKEQTFARSCKQVLYLGGNLREQEGGISGNETRREEEPI